MFRRLLITAIVLVLSACSAAGVMKTSDPQQKLADAYNLLEVGRPIPAERLMNEAIAQFKEKNDFYQLGVSQFMYGQFIRSKSFDWPLFRQQYPKTETAEQRNALAATFFNEAIANFEKAIADPALPHDVRTGYYWRVYLANLELQNKSAMCASLQSMDVSNKAYQAKNPGAKVYVHPPHKTFEEFISATMSKAECNAS